MHGVVHFPGRLVALVGLEDVVGDLLLATNRSVGDVLGDQGVGVVAFGVVVAVELREVHVAVLAVELLAVEEGEEEHQDH